MPAQWTNSPVSSHWNKTGQIQSVPPWFIFANDKSERKVCVCARVCLSVTYFQVCVCVCVCTMCVCLSVSFSGVYVCVCLSVSYFLFPHPEIEIDRSYQPLVVRNTCTEPQGEKLVLCCLFYLLHTHTCVYVEFHDFIIVYDLQPNKQLPLHPHHNTHVCTCKHTLTHTCATTHTQLPAEWTKYACGQTDDQKALTEKARTFLQCRPRQLTFDELS